MRRLLHLLNVFAERETPFERIPLRRFFKDARLL